MRVKWIAAAGLASSLAFMAAPVSAQAQKKAQPKIAESQARATALAKIPGGRFKSYELEEEGGRLIYSYDIEVPGKPGIEEVHVDAMTGAVLSVTHESPEGEQTEAREEKARPGAASRSAPYGQWLVDHTVAAHPEVTSVEIAILSNGGCRTVAATAKEDVEEACDADENEPIRTGEPSVEAPTKADPIYDITQALHDANGKLIGAVGMDITPGSMDRDAVVALAARVRREIEARIASKQALFGPAPER